MKLFFHKLFHWEYWPFQIVYFPIYFLWLYYALKARTLFFFNAANPTINTGGFINDSKIEIYNLIPQKYYPITHFVKENTHFSKILSEINQKSIEFPLIAKPNIGLRGTAVKKINNIKELCNYNQLANFDYLLQDLIPYKNEIGIFYIRYPNEKSGTITGIVGKEFLEITGDGQKTMLTLLQENPRFAFQINALKKEYNLNEILSNGETINLVPYGNHARGAKFLDKSNLITPELIKNIDDICQQINGFYFGRIDLMYQSIEDLEQGKNFAIVEINGSASEPTHIYDPKHSLFFAWKELAKHIGIMFKISSINHKNGVKYLSLQEGIYQFKLHYKNYNKITKL